MRTLGIAFVAASALFACGKSDKSTSRAPETTAPPNTDTKTPTTDPTGTPPTADGGARVSTDTPKIDSDAAFYVRVSHTRGERSRDTHSTHTTVELAGDLVHVTETPKGAHSHRRKSFDFTIKLEAEDLEAIRALIADGNLMSLPDAVDGSEHSAPYSYQSASITLRVDGAEHTFKYKVGYSGADERKKAYESASVDAGDSLFSLIHSRAKKRAKEAGEGGSK